MTPFYTILTNYGKTALAEALAAQQPLEIPHMAAGDGGGSYYEPVEEQTNLRNERWRGDLNDLRTDVDVQGQVIAEAIIPMGIDGDWTVREIGLFDDKGGLVAVGKYPESYIPPALSGAKSQVHISIIIKVDNVAAMQLIVDHGQVLASKLYVSEFAIPRSERAFTQRPAGIGLTDFISVKDFGAVGNGLADDTQAIQAAIDSVSSGSVYLPEGLYRVTKSTGFISEFPEGDQPCLYISDKDGFDFIGNGKIIVNEHAQGCIEVQRSKRVRINGPKLRGAGHFPPIDGMTGLSEKGLPSKGYNTQSFFQVYKNNSYNTASHTGAGFGGNFPQWGGGVANQWGMWNGGFIGNAGSGILIHNDCDNIEVMGCEITGFNFSGVAVGFYGDFFPLNKNYKPSKNIRIHDNKLKGNYNGGVTTMHCDGVTVYDNDVNEIGHPDASWEHENVNPGYGYAALGNDFYPAKGVKVHGNNFIDCKRKGIDAHAGDDHIITDNTVERSYYQGIFYTWSGKEQNATRAAVSGNIITDIKQDGIYIAGLDSDDYNYTNIRLDTVASGNTIKNCDRACIYVLSARDVDVSHNILKRDKPKTGAHYGIYVGNPFNNTRKLYNVNVKDNIIVAEPDSGFELAISAELMVEGMITGNNIRNVNGGGIRVSNNSAGNLVVDNMVRVGDGQIGIDVNQTGGCAYPNQVIGGTGINVLNDGRNRMTLESIILYVECNGTASPLVTKRVGGDNIVSVVSSGTGFTINLQGIGSNVKPIATIHSSSDILPNNGSGTYCGYMVQRPSTNTQVHVGLKGDGKSTSYLSLASLTSGHFIVRIELM